jgi:hypothetical protein
MYLNLINWRGKGCRQQTDCLQEELIGSIVVTDGWKGYEDTTDVCWQEGNTSPVSRKARRKCCRLDAWCHGNSCHILTHLTGCISKSLEPELIQIIFKNSVRTAKKTPHFTVTKINWLTRFKEINSVYSENRRKSIKAPSGLNAEVVTVEAGGTDSYHWSPQCRTWRLRSCEHKRVREQEIHTMKHNQLLTHGSTPIPACYATN